MNEPDKAPEKRQRVGVVSADTESVSSFADDEDMDALPASATLAEGSVVAGRYTVHSLLGRGGYAVVYRAQDEVTGTPVALKVLRADKVSAAGRNRMAREAEAALQFDDERLVRVLDSGSLGDTVYLAMELVEGETLRDRLRAGPLSAPETVKIALDVLGGLSALHRRGIVHRDVKPSNILLDRQHRAKLADFGLVTRWNDDQSRATQSHAIVGTLEYVSPEQALGEPLDGRSDLYAMGIVLFEMLSGKPPHESRSSLGTLVAHLTRPAPDVRISGERVPEWLAAVVARLLAKSRDERYPSAEAVLKDLTNETSTRARARHGQSSRVWVVAAGLVLCALLFLGWRARPGPKPPNVRTAEVEGAILKARDLNGNLLWAQDLPVSEGVALSGSDDVGSLGRLRVVDLDGDGLNEVALSAPGAPESLLEVTVFNSDGTERYRRQPGRKVTFGGETYEGFTTNGIAFFIDERGRRRFFLLASHRPWFPSVLEELDPQGRVVSEYFASGVQTQLGRLRLNGREVLVLTGYHNETRGGSVTFLDLENPSGRAPAENPNYRCSDCPQRDPLALVVVPRSDTLRAQSGPDGSVGVDRILVLDGGVIDFATEHGAFSNLNGLPDRALAAYSFAPDLSTLLDVRPSVAMTELHDVFFRAGKLNHRFGERDIQDLRAARIWDGRRWARVPWKVR